MPLWLISIGKGIGSAAVWFWSWPTWAKIALALVLLAATIVGYIAWQRHTIRQLEDQVTQGEVNRAMDGVNDLTNQIEEGKKLDANLANNSNLAERDSSVIANRDSSTYSGEASRQRYCERYCRDSLCAEYRRVHECR